MKKEQLMDWIMWGVITLSCTTFVYAVITAIIKTIG